MIWKFSSGGFVAIVTVAVWFSFGNPCEAFHSSVDLSNYDYNQLNAIVRDALRYLEKVKSQPRYDKLTGQVNSRSQRSDLVGDMAHALRLYQLQELDRMYGSKARPRFGKRAEVTLENVPTYGFEGNFNGGAGSIEYIAHEFTGADSQEKIGGSGEVSTVATTVDGEKAQGKN